MTRLLPVGSAILGAGFTVTFCIALGSLLLRRLKLEFYWLEAVLFAFVTGAACVSQLVFALCLIQQARLTVFLILGLPIIAWAIFEARRDPPQPDLPAAPFGWTVLFWAVFASFFACYLTNSLAPEISPDGSSYHLGNVARLIRHNGFAWDFHSIYSSLYQGMEMLFLVAFSLGRHSAAATVHLFFQTTLPLLLFCYGRRFGCPRAGAFAAIVTYACPIVGITGISAYNDLAVATLLFAVFYLVQVNDQLLSYKLIFLIGLLAGCAVAVKYSAAVVVPFVLIRNRGRRSIAFWIGLSLIAVPWAVRNFVWLANPFAPFANRWFPNPFWDPYSERDYLVGLRTYPAFKSYWDFLLQLTVLGGLVPGMIGPLFLLLPLIVLALRRPQGRVVLFAAAVYSIPAFLNSELRFLVPAIPLLALGLGLALEDSRGALPALALMQSILCWPAVMSTYCNPNAWRVRGFQLRAALRLEPEAAFIASHVGDYAFKDVIESQVPPGDRIFSLAGRAAAYLPRDIVVGYESTEGLRIQGALQHAALTNHDQRSAALQAKAARIAFLLIDDSDSIAENLRNYTAQWGLTKLAEANGTTLYRID